MVRALCERVLIRLYLTAILWLLSHGRYRSVWVGFLHTPIIKVPSASGLMMVSRKGMEPSSFAPMLKLADCSKTFKAHGEASGLGLWV